MVRALASYQCGPGSIPRLGVISGLSLFLVHYSAPRGFLRVLRFSHLVKNQHLIWFALTWVDFNLQCPMAGRLDTWTKWSSLLRNISRCVLLTSNAISNLWYSVQRMSFSKFSFFVLLFFQCHLELRHTCMRIWVLTRHMRNWRSRTSWLCALKSLFLARDIF